jgi:hypothetical protein
MMNFKGCRLVATAAAAAVSFLPLLTACSGHGNGGSTTAPAGAAALTDAEILYGVSPTRNSQVTYQDDVIVMEHGAEAIRSQSSNGLTWTLDANAPGAADIQPDKILFATGRVVGRVLAVERSGGDLAVTLGPMELTDVIKDAQITYQGALDLDKMTVHGARLSGHVHRSGRAGRAERDAPAGRTIDTAREVLAIRRAGSAGQLAIGVTAVAARGVDRSQPPPFSDHAGCVHGF